VLFEPAADVPPRVFPVFQDYGVFPWLTVIENAEFGLETLGLKREEIRQRSGQWLGRLGLSGVTRDFPYTLSGGMKQRVGLARAFASGAEILLLDEPFSAVDEITRDSLQEILLELIRETNGSAILITHSIDEAIKLGDRLIVMNGPPGRIVGEWDCRAFSIGELNQMDAIKYMALHAKVKKAIGKTHDSASSHQIDSEVMDGHG
jgi:NitT/TauT family transport system ATP-binding protein